MASNTLTAWDAVAALAPLIGAGGITSIIIAIISYMKASKEGRRGEPEKAGNGITALLSDSSSIEKLALSIDRLALAADKISLLTAESKQDMHAMVDKFGDFIDIFQKFIDEFRNLRRVVEDSE